MKKSFSLRIQVSAAGAESGTLAAGVYEYANCTRRAELTLNRLDTPGKLTFECLPGWTLIIPEGSLAELTVDGICMFRGYVRITEQNQDGEVTVTAYDQLRYLKANASYVFENMSLAQIIRRIAADFGLKTGALAETGYAFPCLIKENETCLDILFYALSETIMRTGKIFLFYDNAGELALTEAKELLITKLLGDKSLVTGYTYKRDIDSDTYNRIKLVQKNEESGRTDVYLHEDTDTIRKWGLLQYYDEVDEKLNAAQIDEMCSQYLAYYNRVLRTFTMKAIGLPEVRAGSIIPVQIGAVYDLAAPRLLLVEKVTHTFEGDTHEHEMSIEVKSFEQLGGMTLV